MEDPGTSALEEPVTIAGAAHRAGVHPNTVRRLIRSGRLSAQLVRGRHGETWLVDFASLERLMATPRRRGPAPATGDGRSEGDDTEGFAESASAANLPSDASARGRSLRGAPEHAAASRAVDLTVDRARALERYTHGLLTPLVDLLRDREQALEAKEALIRAQIQRIGRLEREVELLRDLAGSASLPAADPTSSQGQAWRSAPAAPPVWNVQAEPPAHASGAPGIVVSGPATAGHTPGEPELPEHVTALAGQMERLRADLKRIGAALEPRDVPPVTFPAPPPEAGPNAARAEPAASVAAPTPTTETPAARIPDMGTPAAVGTEPETAREAGSETPPESASTEESEGLGAITREEFAGLFPADRSRFALGPLQPLAPGDGQVEAPPEKSPETPAERQAAAEPSTLPVAQAGAPATAPPVERAHAAGPAGTVAAQPPDDPFAQADAAVAELRRALAPAQAAGQAPDQTGGAVSAADGARTDRTRVRRWWWPF